MSDGDSENGAHDRGGVRMGRETSGPYAGGDRSWERERGRMATEGDCRGSRVMEQASLGSGTVGSGTASRRANCLNMWHCGLLVLPPIL